MVIVKAKRLLLLCEIVCMLVLTACTTRENTQTDIRITDPRIRRDSLEGYCDGNIIYCDMSDGYTIKTMDIHNKETRTLFHLDSVPSIWTIDIYEDSVVFYYPCEGMVHACLILPHEETYKITEFRHNYRGWSYQTDSFIYYLDIEQNDGFVVDELVQMNRATKEKKVIATANRAIEADGNYTGQAIARFSGSDTDMYYDVLNMQNENYASVSDADYFHYDAESGNTEKLPKWDKQAEYVGGIGNSLLISEMDEAEYRYDSGKILDMQDGEIKVISISGVESAYDIKDSHTYGDVLLFNTPRNLYKYDSKTKEVEILYPFKEDEYLLNYCKDGAVVCAWVEDGCIIKIIDI